MLAEDLSNHVVMFEEDWLPYRSRTVLQVPLDAVESLLTSVVLSSSIIRIRSTIHLGISISNQASQLPTQPCGSFDIGFFSPWWCGGPRRIGPG